MKKLIFIFMLLSFIAGNSLAINLAKYFSSEEIKVINSYLENFHKNLEKLPIKQQCKRYSNITKRINKIEKQTLPEKVLVLIEYIKEKVSTWSNICKTQNNTKNTNTNKIQSNKNNQKQKTNTNIKINYQYLKRNSIIVPITGTAYVIYGVNIKPIYGDVFVKSLLFKNVFGDTADSVIKKGYLISITGQILAQNSFSNGYIYFNLNKPIRLIKDIYTPFYVAISLNKVNGYTTNKPIKINLEKQFNTLKTSIISADNGEEIENWIGNNFASNTYLIRNSKILLNNSYTRKKLRNGFRQIYSLNINSTGGKSILKSIILNTYLYKTSLDTGSFIIKINNLKYENVKFNFSGENYIGNGKLNITFGGYGYDITTGIKLDLYASFKNTKDNARALFSLKDISTYTGIVNQNYTGNYSILWSDNTFKNGQYNYFTDSFLYFGKTHDRYLKN